VLSKKMATELEQIYKCNVCGNVVEVIHTGAGELVCCGVPMELLQEKNEDEGREKHVPVIKENESGAVIEIGSILHPMEPSHYIEWIEIVSENQKCRKKLEPGMEPKIEFSTKEKILKARAFCNVHGLWKANS
jgi:superoxide reductase